MIINAGSIVGQTVVGAVLFGGGTVDNSVSGSIQGGYDGVAAASAAATAFNQGSINGRGASGVFFLDSGYVSNASTGTISGKCYGVRLTNAAGIVDNSGSIASYAVDTGPGLDAAGVDLDDGGTVVNGASGSIKATWKGVEIGDITAGVGGTVLNQGFIYASNSSGSTGAAVWIHGPGVIINAASGTIAGGPFAIVAYVQTTVVNYGLIESTYKTVDFTPGYADRLVAAPGATFFGAVIGGNTIGSSIVSTLEFASGASQGTISGLGSQFVDFGAIQIDNGANWSLGSGNSVVAGVNLTDAGTLMLSNGVFTDNGATTIAGTGLYDAYATVTSANAMWNGSGPLVVGYHGTGDLVIQNGATVAVGSLEIDELGVLNQSGASASAASLTVLAGGRAGGSGTDAFSNSVPNSGRLFANGTLTVTTPVVTLQTDGQDGVLEIQHASDLVLNAGLVNSSQAVIFDDGTGVLTIGTLGGFGATIGNFDNGDEIIVPGVTVASASFNASTRVLTLFGPSPSDAEIGTLQFGPMVTDGSDISVNGVTPCLVAGTRIATERGEVAVEDLRTGDRVFVVTGGSEPVIWIGRRSIDCTRHPAPRKVWPVCIAVHAFGVGRPARDLWLSPDHAVFVHDVLIPVKYLLHGSAIAQVPRRLVTYYHVELPRHAILAAEEMPVKSYLDTGDRSQFANSSAIALHPDFSSRQWEAVGCAPLVVAGPTIEAVRRQVRAMAEMQRSRPNRSNADATCARAVPRLRG